MTQPGGDVYVIIRMVHYVEFPKGKYLVLDQVHQPPAEKIECLRYLENGVPIRMVVTEFMGVEIDTPEDLERAAGLL